MALHCTEEVTYGFINCPQGCTRVSVLQVKIIPHGAYIKDRFPISLVQYLYCGLHDTYTVNMYFRKLNMLKKQYLSCAKVKHAVSQFVVILIFGHIGTVWSL